MELSCDGKCKGWLHMHEPFEIQKCDECGRFENDEEAAKQHDIDCPNCYWPKVDYQDAAMSWIESLRLGVQNHGLRGDVEQLDTLLSKRGEEFLKVLPKAILSLEEIVNSWAIMDEPKAVQDLFSGLLEFLRKTNVKRANGEILPREFATYEELFEEGLVPNDNGQFRDAFTEMIEQAKVMNRLRIALFNAPPYIVNGLYLEAQRRAEPKEITVDMAVSLMKHTFSKEEVEALTEAYEKKKKPGEGKPSVHD